MDRDSIYDSLLNQEIAAEGLATRGSLLTAQGTNADAYAQSVKLGRQVGIPPDVVAADPAPHAAQVALTEYDRVLANSPNLRTFLADPVNAKLAHDDVPALGRVEGSMTALGSLLRGVDLLQSTLYGAAEWGGEATGSRDLAAWGGEGRRRNEAEAARYGTRSQFLQERRRISGNLEEPGIAPGHAALGADIPAHDADQGLHGGRDVAPSLPLRNPGLGGAQQRGELILRHTENAYPDEGGGSHWGVPAMAAADSTPAAAAPTVGVATQPTTEARK